MEVSREHHAHKVMTGEGIVKSVTQIPFLYNHPSKGWGRLLLLTSMTDPLIMQLLWFFKMGSCFFVVSWFIALRNNVKAQDSLQNPSIIEGKVTVWYYLFEQRSESDLYCLKSTNMAWQSLVHYCWSTCILVTTAQESHFP